MVGGCTLLRPGSGLALRPQIALGTLLLAVPALAALALAPRPLARGPWPAAATARLLVLSVLLGAALWVGERRAPGGAVPRSFRPPQAYLDAFRAIHARARPAQSRRRARLGPGDRGRCRASARSSCSAASSCPRSLPGVERVDGGAGRASRRSSSRSSTSTRTGSRSRSPSGSCWDGCAFDGLALAPGRRAPEPQHAHVPRRALRGRSEPGLHAVASRWERRASRAAPPLAWPLLRAMRAAFDSPRGDS